MSISHIRIPLTEALFGRWTLGKRLANDMVTAAGRGGRGDVCVKEGWAVAENWMWPSHDQYTHFTITVDIHLLVSCNTTIFSNTLSIQALSPIQDTIGIH